MGNTVFANTRRKKSAVLPSGVPVVMLSLTGAEQALITNSDENKRRNAIDEMMLNCMESLGNEKPTVDGIERMLSMDRAWFLFELRQFSNRRSPLFVFDYEFPIDEANNGRRRKQRFIVEFNKEDFPQRPYAWVYEKMMSDYREAKSLKSTAELNDSQIDEMMLGEFPIMFENYEDMLAAHMSQSLKLPDSGVSVRWELLAGKKEKEFSKMRRAKDSNSHDQLLQRDPKYNDGSIDGGKPWPVLPLDELSQDDIEALREDVVTKEAMIDTSVTVQYKDDKSTVTQLSLIQVASFFFPSLAK